MARIADPGADPDNETVAAAFRVFREEGREPIALYRYLAAAPELLRGFSELSRSLRYAGTTSRALRELVILRVAQLTRSEYEWFHHAPMAAKAGVGAEKVDHLERWREAPAGTYQDRERAALAATEEVVAAGLSDAGFAALRESFDEGEVVELVLLVTHYLAVSRIIASLGIEVEPDYQAVDPRWQPVR
ncbi:MAG TPA: carboxymuconolactone decarboxylase family protein [Trebonia sp.]